MARELANQPRQSPTEIEIKKRLGEIAELHPQGKSDRVKQQLYHALTQSVTKNPQLGQCDPNTIIIAACQAVALGLDLNPVLGEAYLVPRWNNAIRANECCFQPGYQGLVKLVRKAGQVVSIRAAIVHEGDTFRFTRKGVVSLAGAVAGPGFGGVDRPRVKQRRPARVTQRRGVSLSHSGSPAVDRPSAWATRRRRGRGGRHFPPEIPPACEKTSESSTNSA